MSVNHFLYLIIETDLHTVNRYNTLKPIKKITSPYIINPFKIFSCPNASKL